MAVISKEKHKVILRELNNRFSYLSSMLEGRELKSSTEGLSRGCWHNKDAIIFPRYPSGVLTY